MRPYLILFLLGLALKVQPQVIKAEYLFDNPAVAYGQGNSLTVPTNTGDVQILADLPVTGLSPGFHQVFLRVKDAVKGWSQLTPKSFFKPNPLDMIVGFRYCIDDQTNANAWISKTFPSPSTVVTLDVDVPLPHLSPGFHQIFFQAQSMSDEWSPLTPKSFMKPSPLDTITEFRYCIDAEAGSEAWTYMLFPFPSLDVNMDIGLELGTLSKGIHYLDAAARSKSGIWTPISRGTFFNLNSEPLNITSLEYYFEDDNGSPGTRLTTNDFVPSPNVTLDSVTFSVPVALLEDMKKYYMFIRAVDVVGNRGFYIKDTIVYHKTTGIRDAIRITPELLIFPNPVSDLFNFKFIRLNSSERFTLRIFDETGKKLADEDFSFLVDDLYSFDASSLRTGVYHISVCNSSGKLVARAKFVKK